MPVTKGTLRLVGAMRVQIRGQLDVTSRALVEAWARAWTEVAAEWEAAVADLIAAGDGAWPSRAKVARAERARRAMDLTRSRLQQLAKDLPVVVTQDLPAFTAAAVDYQARMMASQMPTQAGARATLAASYVQVDDAAVDAIVKRTTRQVTSLARPLSAQAEASMKSVLIRGVAVGENPNRAAARMVERVHGAFEGGRNRALVIARTEMLDAHRAAGLANDKANAVVLAGWEWQASLDKRTCPSCWSQHGTRHAVDEAGPNDHQQGRCTRLPVMKSWRDLGFDVEEPPSELVDAEVTFKALPEGDQLAVMGRDRLAALQSGRASWSDLSQRRSTDGWRDSYAPAPVRDLVRPGR